MKQNKESQNKEVLRFLRKNKTITNHDVIYRWRENGFRKPIMRLSSRINNLNNPEKIIKSTLKYDKNGTRYAEYELK